ncbi:MAG: cupin domain-containing protein [Gammaproteobacteria bacterium]|nr:cupin domain-containing protein [Gammaproteobacteria bacterium]
MSITTHRGHQGDFTWEEVPVLAYKQAGAAPFRDVTRQVLFDDAALGCQLRYFEVAPAGHTTLERHAHLHAVMIIRGHGQCLVGERVFAVGAHDLVHIPSLIWHQFRADADGPLGFLCMVNAERDRPQLPSAEDLLALGQCGLVAEFIRR